ncbi:MAG TPA: cupin domain-containing protein [Polyangiales bacterium]
MATAGSEQEVTLSPATPDLALANSTVIPLAALREDPARFSWFQFKPGVKKLILSGAPDQRHISVLWYGYEGQPGLVPLHYHDKTESIFVIDGAQSDPKARYERGSFYFNPPHSGHNVFDSAGLFLLSYAAPPDFKNTADIPPYENLTISPDYGQLKLTQCGDGSACQPLPLAADGGMRASFIKPGSDGLTLEANVLLVLQGSCVIGSDTLAADTLVVAKDTAPARYRVAPGATDCLLYQMAFD